VEVSKPIEIDQSPNHNKSARRAGAGPAEPGRRGRDFPLDVFQIRYFISAATIGNFSEAAIENNISQSSFSKQIMALESELGVELFSRKRRNITLTPAGTCFLDHAYSILSAYNKMQTDISKFVEDKNEVVNIVAIPVMPQYHLTDAISEYRSMHPRTGFNLIETESELVLANLRRMESEFAIMRTDFLDPAVFNITPLVVDHLIALVSDKHPMAKRERVSLSELKSERFLLPTTQSDLHRICVNACARAGFAPNVVYAVSGKPEITFGFVRKGDAISLAMEKVMNHYEMPGCKIIQLEEDIQSTTALVRFKSTTLSPTCRNFENYLSVRMRP